MKQNALLISHLINSGNYVLYLIRVTKKARGLLFERKKSKEGIKRGDVISPAYPYDLVTLSPLSLLWTFVNFIKKNVEKVLFLSLFKSGLETRHPWKMKPLEMWRIIGRHEISIIKAVPIILSLPFSSHNWITISDNRKISDLRRSGPILIFFRRAGSIKLVAIIAADTAGKIVIVADDTSYGY